MYGHRPPTASTTPDVDIMANWGAPPQHHQQAQAYPPLMYERSRYPGGQGQYQPQQQQQYPGANDHLMPPNLGQSSQPLRGHTPQSQGSTNGNMVTPLLLNNLSQHLNNPPAPSNAQHTFSTSSSNQPQQATKQLIVPGREHPPAGSEEEKIFIMIVELLDPELRESALLELSKRRETYEDLALVLWGGFGMCILGNCGQIGADDKGVMASLILEIVNVYPALSPATLNAHASNRVCNALALLQCVASHNETRALFLNGKFESFSTKTGMTDGQRIFRSSFIPF
jgi:CCR4-NOT transcription complex subunit 9